MITRVARPYARALIDTCASTEQAQQVSSQLAAFVEAMQKVPALASMAANPGIPLDAKQKAVADVGASIGIGSEAKRFLALLVQNYRLPHLPEIVDGLNELVKQRLGVVTAVVDSAAEMDERQRGELKQLLEQELGKTVELQVAIDPSLLGGFVAQIGSRRYDVSLSGQLDRMSEQLASGESPA